jgi:hypothetical protein
MVEVHETWLEKANYLLLNHVRDVGEHLAQRVLIFDDGSTKLYRQRLHPDSPVPVQVEGNTPTPEQVEMCRHLWGRLHS